MIDTNKFLTVCIFLLTLRPTLQCSNCVIVNNICSRNCNFQNRNLVLSQIENGLLQNLTFLNIYEAGMREDYISNYNSRYTTPLKIIGMTITDQKLNERTKKSLEQLTELQEFYLQHNDIKVIETYFTKFQKLKILHLENNLISNVETNAFPSSLEKLYINNNKISIFQTNAFPNLKYFDMSNNPYERVDIKLPRISILNASYSNIVSISKINNDLILGNKTRIVLSPTYLEMLDLRNNRIDFLNASVFSECLSLTTLDLRNNLVHLSSDKTNFSLNKFSILNFHNNSIQTIDSALIANSKFSYANFANNLIDFVNFDWFSNSNNDLEDLFFENNKINTIDISTFRGYRLKKLNLSNNLISKIFYSDNNKLNSSDLRTLDFSNNKIDDLILDVFLNQSTNLVYLNLRNNSIKHFPGVADFRKLNFFDISFNYIQKLQDFAFKYCSNLVELNLGNNKISGINYETFLGLNNLVDLDLKNNQISTIVGVFTHLTSLKTLDLSSNSLTVIHYGVFDDLTELNYLNLSHNNLKEINEFTFTYTKHLNELYIDNNELNDFHIEYLTVKHISIYNNKWICKNLKKVLESIKLKDITVVTEDSNYVIESHSIEKIACENEYLVINATEDFTSAFNASEFLKYFDYFNATLTQYLFKNNKSCDDFNSTMFVKYFDSFNETLHEMIKSKSDYNLNSVAFMKYLNDSLEQYFTNSNVTGSAILKYLEFFSGTFLKYVIKNKTNEIIVNKGNFMDLENFYNVVNIVVMICILLLLFYISITMKRFAVKLHQSENMELL